MMKVMTAAISTITTPSGASSWHVTGHSLSRRLLADKRLGMAHPEPAQAAWYTKEDVAGRPRGGADEEYNEHARWRTTMLRVFSTRRVNALTAGIHDIALDLCDGLRGMGPPLDLNAVFSVPFCSRIILHLLGVSSDRLGNMQRWTEQGATANDIDRSIGGMRSLLAFASTEVRERRGNDIHHDVVAELVALNAADSQLDLGRVIKLLAGMLAFGRETPAAALSTTMALLLERPENILGVRTDPQLRRQSVEEALRMFTPPAATPDGLLRYAHADIDMDGVRIRRGDMVLVDIARANFDASVFNNPEKFDIHRDPNPHLTFGSGFYLCNFARLARIELNLGVSALFEAFPTMRMATDTPLRYNTHLRTRSMAELVVSW